MAPTLLSDHDLKVTRAYDVEWPDFGGFAVSARASFVVDRRGVVTYAEQTKSLGDLPDFTAAPTRRRVGGRRQDLGSSADGPTA